MTATTTLKDPRSLEKSYDKPGEHIKKQRHHFAGKVLNSQAMFLTFLIVMYGYEIWAIEKAECLRINAFKLWC